MRKTRLTALLALAIGTLQLPGNAQTKQEWTAQIRSAADAMAAPSADRDSQMKALAALADTVRQIADRDQRLPERFRMRIGVAATRFSSSPLGDESRRSMLDAYKELNGGKAFEFPADVKSIDDARRHARQSIERALEALETDRTEQAAREIMEYLLLVITPMTADAR